MKYSVDAIVKAVETLESAQKLPQKPWVGFDLDGTLAKYDHFEGWDHIGEPVKLMVDEVKALLARGIRCKILTARASVESRAINNLTFEQVEKVIKAWCVKNIGQELEVVSEKSATMLCFFDDSAIQVEKNTGRIIGKRLTIDDGDYVDAPITEIGPESVNGYIEWNTFELHREQIDQISSGLVKGGFAEALPPDDWTGSQWVLDAKTSDNQSRIVINTMIGDYEGQRTQFIEIEVNVAAGTNKMLFKYPDTNLRSLGAWLAKRILPNTL